jgi:DNA replication protein DnaC
MLNNQTMDKLVSMKLDGMIQALEQQESLPETRQLSFDERFGLLVDAEYTSKENFKLADRLRKASLRQAACFEDIDFRSNRGLDRTLLTQLALCNWVEKGMSILISGATGVGKSFLACSLAHKACLRGYTAKYHRTPRFFQELTVSRLQNKYSTLLNRLAKTDVLVLDDFGLAPMTEEQSRDMLEVIDDRSERRPVIIASQLPVENWYSAIPSATIADAIMDRIIHGSYKLQLTGGTLRDKKNRSTSKAPLTVQEETHKNTKDEQ